MHQRPPSRPSRGAALLTALLIVTLVATLAAAMVWRQVRAVNTEAADRARAQAAWVLNGALDWARLILREDARANRNDDTDHLGEVWAVPLAEARLSTFLAADRDNARADEGPEAFLSGTIDDAQARYNLNNLLRSREPDPLEARTVQRLCLHAGVAPGVADTLVTRLRAAANTGNEGANTPLRPRTVAQLAWLGVDAESIRRLEPFVTLLPVPTPVNLNTAPREVIAALIEGLDLASAERLVQARRNTPFKNLDAVKALLPQNTALSGERVSVASGYFLVGGRLRLDERVMSQQSLVRRRGLDVEVVWRDRVSSTAPTPVNASNSGAPRP